MSKLLKFFVSALKGIDNTLSEVNKSLTDFNDSLQKDLDRQKIYQNYLGEVELELARERASIEAILKISQIELSKIEFINKSEAHKKAYEIAEKEIDLILENEKMAEKIYYHAPNLNVKHHIPEDLKKLINERLAEILKDRVNLIKSILMEINYNRNLKDIFIKAMKDGNGIKFLFDFNIV